MDFFPRRHHKTWPLVLAGVIFAVIILFSLSFWFNRPLASQPLWGITFSVTYAEALGLNPKQAFIALLDEARVSRVRLPFYWSRIEKQPGQYDWQEMDWYLDQAQARGAVVIPVIGQKVPRWPECYQPDWLASFPGQDANAQLLRYLETLVKRYRTHPAIIRWQVENEVFFPFGICPPPDAKLFKTEIELVSALDQRPIQATVSGELEPWFETASLVDVLGVSMYRVTWNDLFGYFFYPLSPKFYAARARAVEGLLDSVIISELQAEPWFDRALDQRPPSQWYEIFPAKTLRKNAAFARQTGLDEAYLWGAEWWYYLKESGDDRLWNAAKEIFISEK